MFSANTWIVHFKSLLKVTPRCLCVETSGGYLRKLEDLGGLKLALKERTMSQVLAQVSYSIP